MTATVAVLAAASSTAVAPAGAQAANVALAVDIEVPGVPVSLTRYPLVVTLANLGTTSAGDVELVVRLPAGVTFDESTNPGCAVVDGGGGTEVTCSGGFLPAGATIDVTFGATFPEEGSYPLTAQLSASRATTVSAATTVQVVAEESDLVGETRERTLPIGHTTAIDHRFTAAGPTDAGGATVTGSFPAGGTVVADTFRFSGWGVDRTDDCTLTPSTFACGPVSGAAGGELLQPRISYLLESPTAPTTLESVATIAGRNDPDPTNNTSMVRTHYVDEGADLEVTAGQLGSLRWFGQQTRQVELRVTNHGTLDAEHVALSLTISSGWTVAAPTDAATGRTCTVAPGASTVTCTFAQVDADGGTASYLASVTSPAGLSNDGKATITATTPTAELDVTYNDEVETTLPHEGIAEIEVTATPSTGLAHGDEIDVQVSGMDANGTVVAHLCDNADPDVATDCDPSTFDQISPDEPSGNAATYTMSAVRFLAVSDGVLDCAVDDCFLVATSSPGASRDAVLLDFAPAPFPADGLTVELGEPAYLDGDALGAATIPVTVTCATAGTVTLRVTLVDPPTLGRAAPQTTDRVQFPCTPGTPVEASSDLMPGYQPGSAEVLVEVTSGDAVAFDLGEIDLWPFSDAQDALRTRLEDPDDTTALADFIAALEFRLRYHPKFARAFWTAIFGSA